MPEEEEKKQRIARRKFLALLGGAAFAGGVGIAAAIVEDGKHYEDATVNQQPIVSTMKELRSTRTVQFARICFITDKDREGTFILDPWDTSSKDDDGTLLVTASGARYKRIVNNSCINVKWFGAIGDGKHDDTSAFQKALAYGGASLKTTVEVPNGNYLLTEELVIISNTDFILAKEARLIRGHSGNMLRNYDIKHPVSGGYTGNSHITISGGIFDCNCLQFPHVCNGIALAHGADLTLRDVTIKDTYQGHALEISGDNGVLVENCRFLGFKTTLKELYYVEAIQIEHTGGGTTIWVGDNTFTQNVIVRNCYFGASGTEGTIPWQAGVASHGIAYNIWHENIKVQDCVFEGQSYWGVRPFRWRRATVENNHFLGGRRGIYNNARVRFKILRG